MWEDDMSDSWSEIFDDPYCGEGMDYDFYEDTEPEEEDTEPEG